MKHSSIRFCATLMLSLPVGLQAKRMSYKIVAASTKQQLFRYSYTGQEHELGVKSKKEIFNYRARIYDAKLRRFLSADQAQEQWGAYSYVANNPLSFVDETGETIAYAPGASEEQIAKVEGMLNFIAGIDHEYSTMRTEIINSSKTIVINPMLYTKGKSLNNAFHVAFQQDGLHKYFLDINTNMAVAYLNSLTRKFESNPAVLGLFHELFGHGHMAITNLDEYIRLSSIKESAGLRDREEKRTIVNA